MITVLVCGPRNFTDWVQLRETLDGVHAERGIGRLVEGGARGADRMAGLWRTQNKVSGKTYPADWDGYGRRAGPIRNQKMLDTERPDLVLAFHPAGPGTRHMISIAREQGFEVIEVAQRDVWERF